MPFLPIGRVLVVDDNEDLALLFSSLIEFMGYEARAVFSVKAALDVLSIFSPHVIISDIGMSELSGFDLAREVKRTISAPPLLISVSGWGDQKTVYESLNAGFSVHIVKPVSFDRIVQLLSDYFRMNGIGVRLPES